MGTVVRPSAGAAAIARATERITLAVFGKAREENGGTTTSQATIRIEASR